MKLRKEGSYLERRAAYFVNQNGASPIEIRTAELVGKTDKKTLMLWACDCAERVLPHFESKYPKDNRPRLALEAGRAWAHTGIFKMAVIRKAALDSHAAARDAQAEGNDAACFAARAAGHAVATAHVDAHAFGGATYAVKAIAAADPNNAEANVIKEREWQYKRLLELGRRSSLRA